MTEQRIDQSVFAVTGARMNVRPDGLLITMRSLSSKRTSSGIGSGRGSIFSGGGSMRSILSPPRTICGRRVVCSLSRTNPLRINC